MEEKTIKAFTREMIDAFGDGIAGICVKDAAGNVIKQTPGYLTDLEVAKIEKHRNTVNPMRRF